MDESAFAARLAKTGVAVERELEWLLSADPRALAFETLSDPAIDPSAEMRAALCLGLARAIGLAGMVGGQTFDIEAEGATAPLPIAEIKRLQAMKTGALLSFSVEAGARLAGADVTTSAALSTYGRAIGAAFQIADDILDAEGDAATLGKRAGKDAARNKATLVGALGLEGARRELGRLVHEARAAVAAAGASVAGDVLLATANFIATRKK
jgi:farnesyl diphosphate synthase